MEGEGDFQYMLESYMFSDDLSLYSDSTISAGSGVTKQVIMKAPNQSSNPNIRTFVQQSGTRLQNYTQTRIMNQYKDISKISSVLVAAQKVVSNSTGFSEVFQYLLPGGSKSAAKMIYVTEMVDYISGKNIPVILEALTQSNKEVHRFKIFKDSNGYCYPVVIHFDIDDPGHTLEMILENFPKAFFPIQSQSQQVQVVYLDFMEALTRSLKQQTAIDKLVHGTVYNEIKRELSSMIIRRGKQLVLDMQTYKKLNTPAHINQLIDIIFEQDVPVGDKINKIARRLQVPGNVDIIVTGQYIDNPGNHNVMIRPVIIRKNAIEVNTSNLIFARNRLICQDPATNKKLPCPDSDSYIGDRMRQFISNSIKFEPNASGLTIEDAYRMIIDNQYFCHSTDYGYHYEVLERLREWDKIGKRDSVVTVLFGSGGIRRYSHTFKSNWAVRAVPESNKQVLKTISVNKDDYAKTITLYWDIVEGDITTYDHGLQMIDRLNAINNEGHTDWRLPTLEEVLSIANDKSGYRDFFPSGFAKKVEKIWTSTLLEENEKKRITLSNDDVYFVVKRSNDGQNPRLQIDILDENHEAYVLPVRSAVSAGRQFVKSGNKGLLIANLAFMKALQHSPVLSGDLGQSLDKAAENGMNMASAFNNLLSIMDGKQQRFTTAVNANRLANILFDPNLTQEKKIRLIIHGIMRPYRIDLLVTGFLVDDGTRDMVTVRPMVIYRYSQTIKTRNLQFRRSEFECWDASHRYKTICQPSAEQIADAIKELLERA